MRREDFGPDAPGDLVEVTTPRGEVGTSFIPLELPVSFSQAPGLARSVERAGIALGNLNGLGHQLPNPWVLINPFIRREALASSRIEGTRADFGQLAIFEVDDRSAGDDPDIEEVLNYIRALGTAWDADAEWVTTTSVITAMHASLMEGVRGKDATPGAFRDVPVFFGRPTDTIRTARFVPPPHHEIPRLVDNMNRYVATDDDTPTLVRLAVAHYQFETIHPFRDGNGRLGRMLVPLYLRYWGILDFPLLYISEYFERRREDYLDLLYRVSRDGAWSAWIAFFLEAVRYQAQDAVRRSGHLLHLRESLRATYGKERSPYIARLIDELFARPSTTTTRVQDTLGVSKSTANQLVKRLQQDGVLEEVTGKERYKIFFARPIMDVLAAELDIPDR